MQSPFFAHPEDLRLVLDEFETLGAVKYVRGGLASRGGGAAFGRAADIPELGAATAPSEGGSTWFVVCGPSVPVRPRAVGGDEVFDQLMNDGTIELSPGGLWTGDVLISGRVGTVWTDGDAKALLDGFRRLLRRRFTRVRAYAVGPRALTLLDEGWRLTDAVQSPPEYDLRRE